MHPTLRSLGISISNPADRNFVGLGPVTRFWETVDDRFLGSLSKLFQHANVVHELLNTRGMIPYGHLLKMDVEPLQ